MIKKTLYSVGNQIRMFAVLRGQTKVAIGILVLLVAVLIWLAATYLPPGIDWVGVYRPASRNLLFGNSPFEVSGYYNAPWAALLLIPFAILPVELGHALLLITGLASITYTAYRLGAKPLAMLILLVSPPVLHGALNGNIDWLAALGFILPPQIGLFFVSLKPQIGIAVIVFWLFDAWKRNGWRELVRIFLPFVIICGLSFFMFGFWVLKFNNVLDEWWDASLWPASIPVGLALLIAAIRKRNIKYAMGASPCLSPHVLLHSWVGALLAVVDSLPELIAAVCGLWILAIWF